MLCKIRCNNELMGVVADLESKEGKKKKKRLGVFVNPPCGKLGRKA